MTRRFFYRFFLCAIVISGIYLNRAKQAGAQPLTVSMSSFTSEIECDCPDGYGDVAATVTGGTAPYSYLWSNGATTSTISQLLPGTYTVTVTDAILNAVTDSFAITSLPTFWPNLAYIAPTPGKCNGALFFNPFCQTTPVSAPQYPYFDGYNYARIICNPGPNAVHSVATIPSGCPSTPPLHGLSIDPDVKYTGPVHVTNISFQQMVPCSSNTRFRLYNQHRLDLTGLPQELSVNMTTAGMGQNARLFDLQGNQLGSTIYSSTGYLMQNLDSLELDFGLNINGTVIFEYYEDIIDGDTVGVHVRDTFQLFVIDCGTFSGQVFVDSDQDCIYGPATDLLMPNVTFNIQPINLDVITNDSGQFYTNLPYGTYSAIQTNPYGFSQKCPPSAINFTIDSLNPAIVIDIADTSAISSACDLAVSVASGPARPGFNYILDIEIENLNLFDASPSTLTLVFDDDLQFVSSGNGGTNSGDTISWPVPLLNAFGSFTTTATLYVPPSITVGTNLLSNAEVTVNACDIDSANNTILHQRQVTASFDPNEKSVSPVGAGPIHAIPPDYRLRYKIEFENTGNDTAFRVMLVDTLPVTLDASTMQFEMASHPYFIQMPQPGVLKVIFENILLPDSNTNPQESKGFIQFGIDQMPGLAEGTVISNQAGIYFDFNLPVITEPVFNTIHEGPVAVCQNITLDLDSTGTAYLQPEMIDAGSFDFYGIDSVTASATQFNCNDTLPVPVTLYVNNINGLTDSCQATISVNDNIGPVVTTNNLNIYLDATGQVVLIPSQVDNGSSDNCGISSYSLSQSVFNCQDTGPNLISLTVTDHSGNAESAFAMMIVHDTIAPVAICKDTIIEIDASCLVVIDPLDIDNGSFDNCQGMNYGLSQSTFNCTDTGVNPIVLTVTDPTGNVSTCTSNVTITNLVGLNNPAGSEPQHQIQPNPSDGKLILPSAFKGHKLFIYHISGTMVVFQHPVKELTLELDYLEPGIYLIECEMRSTVFRTKWVKY